MTQDIDNSYTASGGISLDDIVGLFAGISNPWVEITNAPIGSKYQKTDGTEWIKTGAGNGVEDWSRVALVSEVSTLSKHVTFIFSKISASNNDWLRIGEVSSANAAGAVPFAATLREISVAYSSLTGSVKAIRIYKNGVQIHTFNVPLSLIPSSIVIDELDIPVNKGDRIQVRAGSSGGSITDCVVYVVMRG